MMKIKKKARARSSRFAPVLQSVGIGALTYVILVALLLLGVTPEQHDIQVGLPAAMDILATKDVNDMVTTEKLREEAAAQVEPSYRSVDTSVAPEVMADLDADFKALMDLRERSTVDEAVGISDEDLAAINESLPVAITREEYVALVDADSEVLNQLFEDTRKEVRDVLNNTLLDGQQATAIATMSRTLSYSGYTAPLVSLCTGVMRACVRPNMPIDEEATEANREKARSEVETVTRLKGEVIVRRGEIVTKAQHQMLSSLGLLKEESIDLPLVAGIALIMLMMLSCLAMYLLRYHRELLKPRPLTLMCVIYVLVVALSLAISRWNNYLMPVALGMMLMSLTVNQRFALYFNLALGMTVSLLTDTSSGLFTVAMFSGVLMSLISGPIILLAYSGGMQRTTTLFAGLLAGAANFLVTLGVGLINSAELSSVLTNALWAMAGGLLSAVLCIGFQPLLEWMFNLATNAKLIELSNPNQPLLRRLLLEAPGTYHHSIIVANLAEAAATAVGGNGLLARVGAYYHDVGKLKRPVYFKENQMGDNPHDRTDPRVSAAILTAHPRDGAAMAQKARIPQPVLDIIRQHHGDGVVLWFYDKAAKLYGADQVDISAFRYDGPRPRSKEAAVVMLADSIEAAVRSIPDPTPEKVDALIRKLVRIKLDDGQLDESILTFSDLERICSAFSTVLTGVFHERIEYPDVAIPPRNDKGEKPAKIPEAKPVEAKAADAKSIEVKSDEKPAKPLDVKPTATKPIEEKPAETKPVEAKADDEPAKPVDVKPIATKAVEGTPAEFKPVEPKADDKAVKSVETKPAEPKPVETKPETSADAPEIVVPDAPIVEARATSWPEPRPAAKPIVIAPRPAEPSVTVVAPGHPEAPSDTTKETSQAVDSEPKEASGDAH